VRALPSLRIAFADHFGEHVFYAAGSIVIMTKTSSHDFWGVPHLEADPRRINVAHA
jgi:hypothetical protein